MHTGRPTVLLVNKFFYPRAGAETAFFHTRDLLKSRGHRVLDFAMEDSQNRPSHESRFFAPARSYGDGANPLNRVRDAGAAVYSITARRALGRLLDEHRPDVAHIHNVYHQLTLSVVDELHRRNIPIVQTLHDYKIACPAYTLFTEGKPCHRCVHSRVTQAIRHRCVKGSVAASSLAALEAGLAHTRGTYSHIDRFIAPSRFIGGVAESAGIPPARVRHLPYFMPESEIGSDRERRERPPVFFFGGRLDETKGIRELIAAFELTNGPAVLRIAGWGPLQADVESAAESSPRIEYVGSLPRPNVLRHLEQSRALVLPSIWEDNCPLVMLEARARSTPVIVSSRGGPPEFVREGVDGLIVDPTDAAALATAIQRYADNPRTAMEHGASGRAQLLVDHNADRHYSGLMSVYDEARTGRSPINR